MKRDRKSRGFTLVELAVTVCVAGVALTATAGAVTSGARLARTTAETRAASRAAACIFERIRATSFVDIVGTYNGQTFTESSLGGGESSGTSTVQCYEVYTGSTRWKVLYVQVTTTWKGQSGTSTQKLATYVCDRADGSSLSGSRTTVPAN